MDSLKLLSVVLKAFCSDGFIVFGIFNSDWFSVIEKTIKRINNGLMSRTKRSRPTVSLPPDTSQANKA